MKNIIITMMIGFIGVVTVTCLNAQITIEAQANQSMNAVLNPSFENGLTEWELYKTNEISGVVLDSQQGKCLCLISKKNRSLARQRIYKSIKKGTKLYISAMSKTVDYGYKNQSPSLSLHVEYVDGTSAYLPSLKFPTDDHDWMKCSKYIIAPKDIKIITIYLCNESPTGKTLWNSIKLICGKLDLTYIINLKNMKQVYVYSSSEGVISKSKIFSWGIDKFTSKITIDCWKRIIIKAISHTGVQLAQYSLSFRGKY
jgi:hypothetical protein